MQVVTRATKAVSPLTKASDGCAFDPTWSKTNTFVVYIDQCAAAGGTRTVRKVSLPSGTVSTVVPVGGISIGGVTYTYDSGRADVTPDGTKVVWRYDTDLDDGGLAVTSPTGTGFRSVAEDMVGVIDGSPAISPDGRTVVTGYGWENSQIQSFCLASPCGSFYYDIPNDSTWVKSLDWQPLP